MHYRFLRPRAVRPTAQQTPPAPQTPPAQPNPPSQPWIAKLADPMTLFTAVLAVGTVGLAFLALLQWRVLEKTDATMKAQLKASTAAQRARISVGSMTVTGGEKPDTPWIYSSALRNVGTTQAISVRVEAKIIRPSPTRNEDPRPILHMPTDPIGFLADNRLGKEVLAPGVDRPLPQVTISRAEYKTSRGNPTYLIGVVTYDDIFDKLPDEGKSIHITKFCFQIGQVGWQKAGGLFGTVTNVLNDALLDVGFFRPNFDPCPYWNCADETCPADREDYHHDLDVALDKAAKDIEILDKAKRP